MRRSRDPTVLACLVVLAACGDDGTNHLADAPPGDAHAIDGSVDGLPEPVTIAVTTDGAPTSGVRVYFLDADSSVVSNTTTASDGTASALMAAGGSVTVLEPPIGSAALPSTLDTFSTVQPGDELRLDLVRAVPTPTTLTLSVTLPSDPAAASTTLTSSCESTVVGAPGLRAHVVGANPPVPVTLTNCGSGTVDFLVTGNSVGNGQPFETVFAPGQTVSDGGSLTLSGPFVPVASDVITLDNAPESFVFSVEKDLVTASGEVFLANLDFTAGSGSGVEIASTPFPSAASTAGATEIVRVNARNQTGVLDSQVLLLWGPPADLTALDASMLVLPDDVGLTPPSFDSTTQAVTWVTTTGGVMPDAVIAGIEVTRGEQTWVWNLAAPAGASPAVSYPTLPTDVLAFNPAATDSVGVVNLETIKLPGGYGVLRHDPFDKGPGALPVAGMSGTASYSFLED